MQKFTAVIGFGFGILFAAPLHAANLNGTPIPLEVKIMQEPTEFADPFYSAFITSGENKFTFMIPQGLRLVGDTDSGRITLGNQAGNCSMSFTILSCSYGEDEGLNVETCRAEVLKNHENGKILQEFSGGILGRSGPGFDVQWKVAENLYQCERVVYIPTAYGIAVFRASAGRSGFTDAQSKLGLMMSTFRDSKDGKFRPIHIPSNS